MFAILTECNIQSYSIQGLPLLCVGNETDGEGVACLLDFTNLLGEERMEGGREGGREGAREGSGRRESNDHQSSA